MGGSDPMRRLLFVLFALASPFLWNCSENDTPAVADRSEPEVLICYPYDREPTTFVVKDSINVYFAAHDLGPRDVPAEPTKVELWFSHPGTSSRVFIGTAGQAISLDQVPVTDPYEPDPSLADSIRKIVARSLPAGWSLYVRRWYTGPLPLPPVGTPINTGTKVQLFALAYDAAGNVGRTPDVVQIAVTNLGDDNHPPVPVITVSPQSGTTADTFVFDASATTDAIDTIHKISVRWDFDGNPGNGWDIDWNRDARADEKQNWQFLTPRSYRVALEAHNSYIPDSISGTSRPVIVTPIGGDPRPPEPDNYATIPGGTYVLGDTSYVSDGRTYQADLVEQPIHPIFFTSSYLIEKTEVTNRLYLNYLRHALRSDHPDSATIEYRGGVIYSRNPAHPEDEQEVYFVVANSRIFFNLDTQTFAIQPGFEDHPVTGVTWFGATAYALAYGLRLPTEAEWEVAARGANEDWSYPFIGGAELTRTEGPRRVNYAGSRSGAEPFVGTTTPRGFYDGRSYQGFQTLDTPSVFGTYDMAGNVGEWVADWMPQIGDYTLPEPPPPLPLPQPPPPFYPSTLDTDPQGVVEGINRVVRGGSYLLSRTSVRCTARMGLPPGQSYSSVGFRTAYILPVVIPPSGR